MADDIPTMMLKGDVALEGFEVSLLLHLLPQVGRLISVECGPGLPVCDVQPPQSQEEGRYPAGPGDRVGRR